jgi:hypothetical protein
MSARSLRLLVVIAAFLLATSTAQVARSQARCVTSNGLSYCCWGGHMCRVCDSVKCFLVPASGCPQGCPF